MVREALLYSRGGGHCATAGKDATDGTPALFKAITV
jgi:hypothetical protein